MDIQICSTLSGVDQLALKERVCVVIDVLRASTTAICLFDQHVERVQVVATPEEARALKPDGWILVGERGDVPLRGFDLDNSPSQVLQRDWTGRQVVLTTSNGTGALLAVRGAYQVAMAGFRNVDAVAAHVAALDRPVVIIPVGSGGQPRLEDELCATALHDRIHGQDMDWEKISEQIMADRQSAIARKGPRYRDDVMIALQPNASTSLPVLRDGLVLTNATARS